MSKNSLLNKIVNEVFDKYKTSLIKEVDEEGESEQLYPLKTWKDYVVLTHDSSAKITDGVINNTHGKPNTYSTRDDFGNYFWGGLVDGKDNSNIHTNRYYCLVPKEYVYDMMANEKNYESVKEAMYHEKYVAYNWVRTKGAVVVKTFASTPISFISYNPRTYSEQPGFYDKDWNLVKSYSLIASKRGMKKLLKQLEWTKTAELPDFVNDVHGYSYDDALEYYNKLPDYYTE